MEIQLVGSKTKKVSVTDSVFACDFNEALIHQVVTAYMSAGRAGTHAQKTRAEVRGGGAKPWRQKGTGRARAGTIRSPLWRKGGRIFAAKTQSYKQKVNRKMYRAALRSIFSELVRAERLKVVEKFQVKTNKTKDFLQKLKDFKLEGNVLIVLDEVEKNLHLATRNLPEVNVSDVAAVNPVALVGAEHVIVTEAAMKQIEELLK